jgi:hypothetical protein
LAALSREMVLFPPPLPHDKRKLVLHFLTTNQEELSLKKEIHSSNGYFIHQTLAAIGANLLVLPTKIIMT